MIEESYFREKCKNELYQILIVNDIKYKADYNKQLFGECFRVTYSEYHNGSYIWSNTPIDLFYKITDEPQPKRNDTDKLYDTTIYKTNFDDIIKDCFIKLNNWHKGLYKLVLPDDIQLDRNNKIKNILNS
jgi:hypothetical protein